MKFGPKHYEQQILRKNTAQNLNQHITMCPCIKFQSIWRTLDFGTTFAQNYMNDKFFKRINIKIVISSNVPQYKICSATQPEKNLL